MTTFAPSEKQQVVPVLRPHEKNWNEFFDDLINVPVTKSREVGLNFRNYCEQYQVGSEEEELLLERVLYELALYFNCNARRSFLEGWFSY